MNFHLNTFVFYVILINCVFCTNRKDEIIICRKCGADIADSNYIINQISPGSRRKWKETLFGKSNVTVQNLINPLGIDFNIITVEKSRCVNLGARQRADSWYPEHTWRICLCPQCGQHIGWTFESINEVATTKFHGLVLANVLSDNITESILLMPNSYKM